MTNAGDTEWEYYPSRRVDLLEKELWAKVQSAGEALKETGGATSAAIAFARLLEDDLSRRLLKLAAIRFDCATSQEKGPRQGDISRVVSEINEVLWRFARLSDALGRLHTHFGQTPGAPAWSEISVPSAGAFEAIGETLYAARDLERAVLAEHGPDAGGPRPLADALAGDPLDRLADDLAAVWTGAGHAFDRAGWRDFEAILRALTEALGGGDDLPERALRRIKRNLKNGTQPPEK